MSTTIDNKVVEMRFDNKQFESGVQTTLGTLDKLKQGLNLSGASKGLENIKSAAGKIDMTPLCDAADSVRSRFTALEVMAVTALANITNSAVNAGKRIVKALTIDPITTGFQEYETQINAVQTILANTESKGTTLEEVNQALDELNAYADKTIYNFTQMTKNIGTFTAAGIDLDTSVSAIQGIANLAAVSGSTSQQASTAMYQLSQALASGTVKLMDWNSVVNAGMGGQVFQDALKETARVHGIAVDDMIAKHGSFRESLSEGWITSEILTETLKKFTLYAEEGTAEWEEYKKSLMSEGYTAEQAEEILKMGKTATEAATKVKTFTQLWDTLKEAAQSGWSQSWEIIVGDFEEAKALLTEISEVLNELIGNSANARIEVLENWKALGGRTAIIDALRNAFEAVMSVVTPVAEAFKDIFPPITAEQLVAFSKGLRDLIAKLKLSDDTSENLKATFRGLFAIFSIIKKAIVAVFNVFKPLFSRMDDAGGGILRFTAAIGDWLTALNASIEHGDLFNKTFSKIAEVVKKVGTYLKETFVLPGLEIATAFVNKFKSSLASIGLVADGAKTGVTSVFESIGQSIQNSDFFKILQSVWKGVETLGSALTKVMQWLGKGIANVISNIHFETLFEIFSLIVHGGIALAIIDVIKSFNEALAGLPDILGGVTGCFEEFQNSLQADTLLKIGAAIGILAVSLLVLSLIEPDRLGSAISAITTLFAELVIAMKILGGMGSGAKETFKTTKIVATVLAMSTAVLILASALKKISGLNMDQLKVGLLGVTGMLLVLIGTMKLMSMLKTKATIAAALQMIVMATAINILASAVTEIAALSWEGLAKGLVGLVVMLGAMVGAVKLLTTNGNLATLVTGAGSILVMSASLLIMAVALERISKLSWEELGRGLAGIAGVLLAMVAAVKMMPIASSLSAAISMVLISGAMIILTQAMKEMAKLSWESIGKSLVVLAGSLLVLSLALRQMLIAKAGAMALAISVGALWLLVPVMYALGKLSWEQISKGLVTIGIAVGVLAIGLKLMSSTFMGAAAMLTAAAALAVLTPILYALGNMSWEQIAKGLITIAAAFAIIGVAGLVLSAVTPYILALSIALALVGTSIVLAAAGLAIGAVALSALAVGITALAGALAAGATAIVSGLKVIILGIADLIPELMARFAEGIIQFSKVITNGAPALAEAFTVLVLALIQVIVDCAPAIIDAIFVLLSKLTTTLVEYTPVLVDNLFKFIIAILDGIAQNLPALIQSVVDIIMALFQGVVDALATVDIDLLKEGLLGVGFLSALMVALGIAAGFIPAAILGAIGIGLVLAELALVLAAVGALASLPGLTWLVNEGGTLLQAVGTAIGKFVGGFAGGFAEGVSGALPQIASDLSQFMTNLKPFIDGVQRIDEAVLKGVIFLVGAITAITATSLLTGITSFLTFGTSSITKFAEELPILGEGLKGFADAVSGINPEEVIAAAKAAAALALMTAAIPNEGGVISWFAGENSISKFASELPLLGEGLRGFSDAVAGIIPENIIAAANAAKVLAEMTATIPNEGGVVSWFAGDNSIAKFAMEIITLGYGIKGFSDAVAGVSPDEVTAAADAAKTLAEMTATIPDSGGVVSWFAGDNSIANFATDIVSLGQGIKGFSDAVAGVSPEEVTAAANAGKSLAEMTAAIPTEGGIVAWFAGDRSVSKFASELPTLGDGLKGFSDSVSGINPDEVTAAANAAKTLAEMTATIPTENGVVSWFTGERSVTKFASELPTLGDGLKGFSDSVSGIVPDEVKAAAEAAKTLAEMTTTIPAEGGIESWFAGERSISKFSGEIPKLGDGLKGFSDSVSGINPDNVTAAANAAASLAEMTANIPSEGGIKAWFTGDSSITTFANKLPTLGDGLKGFSNAVSGINPDNVTAAANAAKTIAEMSNNIPSDTNRISSFAKNLESLGAGLRLYFSYVSVVTSDVAAASKNATDAIKEVLSLQTDKITSVANAIEDIADALKELAQVPKDCTSSFNKALTELGESCIDSLLETFTDAKGDFEDAAKDVISAFIEGMESREKKVKLAGDGVVDTCVDAIDDSYRSFKSAGKNVVIGFANGIDENTYRAEAKARAMARAAANAAEEELDINSPSKVGYSIGGFFTGGFINALTDNVDSSYNAGSGIAEAARKGLAAAASKIQSLVNGDMDMQPTISPVLDLSGVRTGVNAISGMFSSGASLGVSANVGAISMMMNRRNQNGESEVVSALNELRKDIGNMQTSSYTINGITYDDGSNIASAVSDLVRAAKVERRI